MVRKTSRYLAVLSLAFVVMLCRILLAGEHNVITPFSTLDPAIGIPTSWKPLIFPKIPTPTEYRPKSMEGRMVIEARSNGGASGLIHKLDVDPHKVPWLSWQWRVDNALERADVATKAGDDCAARIYIAFKFDTRNKNWWERFSHQTKRVFAGQEIPGSAIVYAWTNRKKIGSIIDSPYTPQSKLIAVRGGSDVKGRWVTEKKNIVKDYVAAFGVDPPAIIGIAIMTDTDNTGGETTAYYGDIRLTTETSGFGDS